MANIFEAVKAAVPVPLAAERYGLKANHAGMVRCPFHDDHTPSLKLNEDYFYCFGCGAGGDVVELTRRLFNLRTYEAASKLAVDFGVDVPASAPPDGSLNRFRTDLLRCQQVLDEYLNLLSRWQRLVAPRSPDGEPDERYVEACQMLEPIDYMATVLAAGTLEQRIHTVERLMADGKMDQLEERLTRLTQEENVQNPVKRSARSGGTARPFQIKRRETPLRKSWVT